jgi:hypothetical protein
MAVCSNVYELKSDKTVLCTVNDNYNFNILNPMCFLIYGEVTLSEKYGDSLELTLETCEIQCNLEYQHPIFGTLCLYIEGRSCISIRGRIISILKVTPILTEILVCELPNWDAFYFRAHRCG